MRGDYIAELLRGGNHCLWTPSSLSGFLVTCENTKPRYLFIYRAEF